MAEVWEAQHVHLGNRTAVKFLLPEFATNQELQERFLNEGKRQAQLQHPNIVPAIDFFQVEGRSYLVMQYIEGTNLEARLQKENPPLTLKEIQGISSAMLSALSYAHSLGVIHRDVKPANMLIDKHGKALLTDFGIAKALREDRTATLAGTAMGTPDYMSPEQIVRPKDVDARSDVYSFGCVLYAMISGNPPFGSEGATAFFIQDRHVRVAPPQLVYRNPDVPQAVGAVVFKCLEKEPDKRYQSCAEVMTALDDAIAGKVSAPPESGLTKYLVAGVLAVILIAGAVYSLMPKKNPRRERLLKTDWTKVQYNNADFSDCMDVQPCKERKAQAEKLVAANWQQVKYDSPLLNDCMGYQPCLDRESHAEKLQAVSDWGKPDEKPLLSDCMDYQPCVLASKMPVKPHVQQMSCADIAETYPCCRDYSNPTACLACKKKENLADCVGVFQNP